MKKQITRISIAQTSKVLAIMYAAFGLVHFIFGVLLMIFGKSRGAGIMLIFMPVIIAILGYLGAAFFSWIYNFIASKVGGIEFELSDIE